MNCQNSKYPGLQRTKENTPEVRNKISPEDLEEPIVVDAGADSRQPEKDANCGHVNLGTVVRHEYRGIRVEV